MPLLTRRKPRPRHQDSAGGWTLQGSPFEVRTPDGAIIQGEERGTGPAVILAHCWTGDRSTWEPVAARLASDGHRVISYDQRGHGQSSEGTASPSIATLASDLLLVLETRNASDVVLAGHSLGGMAIMQAAATDLAKSDLTNTEPTNTEPTNTEPTNADSSGRIAALVLVSTSARPLHPVLRRLRVGSALSAIMGSRIADKLIRSKAGGLLSRPALGATPSPTAKTTTLGTLRTTARHVRGNQLREIGAFDALDELKTITIPTRILVGTRDRVTPPSHAKAMTATIPNATLTRLSKAGHMLPLERPDAVAEAIARIGGTRQGR